MKILRLVLAACLLAGCAGGMVYKKAPAEPFKPQYVFQIHGQVEQAQLYFTAVVLQKEGLARMVVLGDMGVKLLDVQVSPRQAWVYYKMPRMPGALAGAFARMAQEKLLVRPQSPLLYQDHKTKLVFKAQLAGEKE